MAAAAAKTSTSTSTSTSPSSFIGGIYLPEHAHDAVTALGCARTDGFEYCVTELPVPLALVPPPGGNGNNNGGSTAGAVRTDVTRLESKWWSTSVVGMVADPPHWTKKDGGGNVAAVATAKTKTRTKAATVSITAASTIATKKTKTTKKTTTTTATATTSSAEKDENATSTPGSKLLRALTSGTSSKQEEANKIFWGMMEWASHMNIPAVILPSIPLADFDNNNNNQNHDDDHVDNDGNKKNNEVDSDDDMFDDSADGGKTKLVRSSSFPLKKRSHVDIHSPPTNNNNNNNNNNTTNMNKTSIPTTPKPTTTTTNTINNTTISINNPSAKEYARILASLSTSPICTSSHVQLWIRVPLTLPSLQAYQLLLSRCDHSPHIGCMIYINDRLGVVDGRALSSLSPSTNSSGGGGGGGSGSGSTLPQIVRALHSIMGGGNVKAVSWDRSVFLKNKKGYPTLAKSHQYIFQLLFGRLGRTLRVLVEGSGSGVSGGGGGSHDNIISGNNAGMGLVGASNTISSNGSVASVLGGGSTHRLYHLQYLRHLRSRPPLLSLLNSEEAILETPYLDHLQSPLQPLGDHLEYQTYETFEKDPVKYKQYGEAVALALEDGIEDDLFDYLGSTSTTVGQLKRMNKLAKLAAASGGYVGGFDDLDNDDYNINGGGGDDDDDDDDDEEDVGNNGEMVEVDIHQVTIMVVGAGRGPLVREAIAAVSRVSASWMNDASYDEKSSNAYGNTVAADKPPAKRRKALYAKVIAIEKNPSAVLYLNSLKCGDPSWNGGQEYNPANDTSDTINGSDDNNDEEGRIIIPGTSNVTVIGCDMRHATSHPLLKYMIHHQEARADVVVSELLGSFGDNELSPECLDGVQRCGILKDSCISVPQSYTSFIAPVSSARLHSEAKSQSCLPLHSNEGPSASAIGMQRAMETPYVVRSHAASQTHLEQACWKFSHPHPSSSSSGPSYLKSSKGCSNGTTPMDTDESDGNNRNGSAEAAKCINNDRHIHLSFRNDDRNTGTGCGYGALDAEVASMGSATAMAAGGQGGTSNKDTTLVIHGFLGSFHSVLYESPASKMKKPGKTKSRTSVISIAPHSFSVGMFSWFPLYFPLKEPLRIPPGATVNCSIWRRSDDGRVWYEWCAEVVSEGADKEEVVWSVSSVHNPGGRSYHVRL